MDTETMTEGENIARIMTGVHRLSSVMGRSSEDVLQETCGFGVSQFRVLWVLHTHKEGVQQNAIARWMNMTEAAVSRQLQLMKKQGLLSVETDERDRRSRLVMLTPEGREFTQSGINRIVEKHAPAFASLGKTEQLALLQMLDTLFYKLGECLNIQK